MILSGADVRLALMARRAELIRCASIAKDDTFDVQISDLDIVIENLWNAIDVDLVDVSDT